MSAWKPGDVALFCAYPDRKPLVVFRHKDFHDDRLLSWTTADEGHAYPTGDDDPRLRPLVVIDPESPDDIERLSMALAAQPLSQNPSRLKVQAALRSLVAPPRPEEPMGLGAVVEDAEGNAWVRASRTISAERDDWRCVEGPQVGYWQKWDRLDVARVLAEGWVDES